MSQSIASGSERRRHPRVRAVRPAKVFLRSALRYSGGETADVSESGALLRIESARPIRAGDRVDVAVVRDGSGDSVVESKGMRAARVVRVSPLDRFFQSIAVEFEAPVTLSQAA